MDQKEQDLRIQYAQSIIVVQEKNQQYKFVQEVITSGEAIRLKHQNTGAFVFSYQNKYKSTKQNKSSQQQVVFCLDNQEFEDNIFIIHKLNPKRSFEDKFKFMEQDCLGEPINSGDEIVLQHKQTRTFLCQSTQFEAPVSKDQFEISCTNLNTPNINLLQFVFIAIDINANYQVENLAYINLASKYTNQNLHSHDTFYNQELQQFEVTSKPYEDNINSDTFQIQLVEASFMESKVPVDDIIEDGDVLTIRHLRSGCKLGTQEQVINKQNSVDQVLVKNTSEQLGDNPDDLWQIKIQYQERNNIATSEKNGEFQNRDIVTLRNVGKRKQLATKSSNFCLITQSQPSELVNELEAQENDEFQLVMKEGLENIFKVGSIFSLLHVNTEKFLECSKYVYDESQQGTQMQINFKLGKNNSQNANPFIYQYITNFSDKYNDNTLFQIVDRKKGSLVQ